MGAGYTFAMPVDRIRRPACFLCALCVLWIALAGTSLMAQSSVAEWRAAHERQIIDELMTFVGLPNVAGNDADMRKNAELAAAMFTKRGFTVETSQEKSGSPVVFASLDVPQARGTLTFYIHYDGQPVTASEWTRCGPFAPCLIGPSGAVAPDAARKTLIRSGGCTDVRRRTTRRRSSPC